MRIELNEKYSIATDEYNYMLQRKRMTGNKYDNRIEQTVAGAKTTYSYDANDRLITEDKAGVITNYTYDNQGNTLTETKAGQVTQYSYNAEHELVNTSKAGMNASYSYNLNGIRTEQTINGVSTRYLNDNNMPYASVLMAIQNQQPVATYIYGDDLISYHQGTGSQYYLYDGLGSTRALASTNGQVTDTYTYDAYGETLDHQGSSNNAYQYAGEQKDETGHYYLRARYYNPGVGRFTQMDTYMGQSGNPITLHKYLYANASPTIYTDPSGHFGLSGFSFSGLLSTMQSAARYSTIAVNTLDKVDTVITLIQMTRGADQAFDALRREVKSQSNGSNNLNSFIGALNNSDEAAMTLAANAGWLMGQMALPELESKVKEFIKNPKNKLLIYPPTPESYVPWISSGTRIKIGAIGLSKGARDVEIEIGRASSQGGRMVGFGHSFAN